MKPSASTASASYTHASWVSITPLGSPVVPEVYIRVAMRSGVMPAPASS